MTRPSSRTTRSPRGALALAGLALAVVATACGDDDDTAATEPAAAATSAPRGTEAAATTATMAAGDTTLPPSDYYDAVPPGTAGAATTDGAMAGGATVAIAESSLGPILVDGDGMTLYMFAPDEQGPSTCVDACLEAWPAVPGPAAAGEGADPALLGTATRPDDGSEQATCNGWPLYTFVQDAAPGDVNGQGVNDVWFVLDATCTPVGM